MTPEQLAALHPRLYHTTEAVNLEAMLRHGLLSTRRILDLCGRSVAEREEFVRQRDRLVLVLDTGCIASAYAEQIERSPINSGSSLRKPARRRHATFTPLLRHDYGA
jgi:RNA:NAD 2'-phosphotransferase (TPT1/KptA family)